VQEVRTPRSLVLGLAVLLPPNLLLHVLLLRCVHRCVCVCVCVCACVAASTHTHARTHTRARTHTHKHTHTHARTHLSKRLEEQPALYLHSGAAGLAWRHQLTNMVNRSLAAPVAGWACWRRPASQGSTPCASCRREREARNVRGRWRALRLCHELAPSPLPSEHQGTVACCSIPQHAPACPSMHVHARACPSMHVHAHTHHTRTAHARASTRTDLAIENGVTTGTRPHEVGARGGGRGRGGALCVPRLAVMPRVEDEGRPCRERRCRGVRLRAGGEIEDGGEVGDMLGVFVPFTANV